MTHLVAMHHEVVRGDQGFENHHPAGVAGPLHQRVSHLGDVHVGFLGGLDQDCEALRRGETGGQLTGISRGETQHRYSLSRKTFYSSNDSTNHCGEGVRRRLMGVR